MPFTYSVHLGIVCYQPSVATSKQIVSFDFHVSLVVEVKAFYKVNEVKNKEWESVQNKIC